MEQNTLEVTEQPEVFAFTSIRDLVNQTLHENFGRSHYLNGLSTGFKVLDEVTGGFQKGQLITVAVKPGMGKTAFLLSLVNNLAVKSNHTVAVFSAERSNEKMMSRLIESETGMSLDRLQYGPMKASEKAHMHSLVSSIAKANIFFDDTPAQSIDELVRKCRQLKLTHHVDLIIIDYLELLSTYHADPESRNEQLSGIVKNIREAARELDIPLLLFSQTPAPFPSLGQVKPPSLKDIPVFVSELSDMVIFLHRNLISGKNGKDAGKSMVDLVVAKNKDQAEAQTVSIAFLESVSKFVDPS